jgi:hypothetical protein
MVRRRVLIDVGPLRRSKDFRYLFFGEMVSLIGSGLTTVAVPFQLYSLTGSSLQVGLASLAQLVPLIACSFVGGAIADTYDRRRVLLFAERHGRVQRRTGAQLDGRQQAGGVAPSCFQCRLGRAGLKAVKEGTRFL